jgi:eukaryotic-like serine/threonine-protein kinase
MGEVFVAEHLKLHKQVALKVVRAELAGNREILARFAREAMAGSRIDHPSVVAALDYGSLDDGGAFLVMPLVPGECLTDLMSRGALPWARAAELGVQIADALAAAWAQGFVHRDLKPDNILLEPRADGAPLARVLDFGVAKLSESLDVTVAASPTGAEQLTKEGAIIGTPGYMAPEQALGRPATHTADLYSLGVLLWEAVVGRPLWTGDTIHAIMRAQLKESWPSLRQASSDTTIPSRLDDLVQRLLSRSPEQRPQSAVEVRDTLRDILQSAPPPAPRVLLQEATLVLRSVAERARAVPASTAAILGMLAAGAVLVGLLVVGPFELSVQADSDADGGDVPASLEPAMRELAHGTSAKTRAASAREVMKYAEDSPIPEYAESVAKLELAESCAEKRAVLSALNRLEDPRARPVLERLSSESTSGCGPRKNLDCLGCLRGELRQGLSESAR